MTFIMLHQKGKPVIVAVEALKIIYPAVKGGGSFIVTDIDGHDLEIDETQEEILQKLGELEIEVDLFANDD